MSHVSSAALGEHEARRAREEMLGRLASCVAHDFKNLLTVIQANVVLLRRKLNEPAAEPHLTAIHRAGDEATKLIRQLLSFAHGGEVQISRLDLGEAVDESLETVRTLVGPGVTVQSRVSNDRAHVEIDPVQFRAALLNLAANARDAMPTGGTLEFATRAEPSAVELDIIDTGAGMPPEILARVFEPFFTTKLAGKGSGLGLAQVYDLVRRSGGSTDIRSVVGQGTTITLRLPRAPLRLDRA
jgi:signal transduction histidine kinase